MRQTRTGDWLVLFGAPAVEIHEWSGIPQKQSKGGGETTGFQRIDDFSRLKKLESFYRTEQNVIQNPILCAARTLERVRFEAADGAEGDIQTGWIVINTERLEEYRLIDLLRAVADGLAERLRELRDLPEPTDEILRVQDWMKEARPTPVDAAREDVGSSSGGEADDDELGATESILLEEDSHLSDFYQQLRARIRVLEDFGAKGDAYREIAGFTTSSLISFLRPVVVVDGQHRLLGAVRLAHTLAGEDPYLERQAALMRDPGADPDEVTRTVQREASRTLPISLLMNQDPAEHVFQFVVVNQRATPLKPALLGTVVSTTLSSGELDRVSSRLSSAGVELESARIVSMLARHPESPFQGLIQRGLPGEAADTLLHWSVLAALVKMFRDLSGGKLYHENNVDSARKWRREYLNDSGIVSNWQDLEYPDPFAYWKHPQGPWLQVFLRFWWTIREWFGDDADSGASNYWGEPRNSDLFNKPSLTILAADFFRFLVERGLTIPDADAVPGIVRDQWLKNVKRTYFTRRWPLDGVKKDSAGIRNQWAMLWNQYRTEPLQLPPVEAYRKAKRL